MKGNRAILIDDEPRGLNVLEHFCSKLSEHIEIIASSMNSVQSVSLINQLKPELLIMDIQMPQMNAFDVLNNVRINFVLSEDISSSSTIKHKHFLLSSGS